MTAITAATSAGRRALRRLLTPAADQDRLSRRAGAEPVGAAMVTPRTWIALA